MSLLGARLTRLFRRDSVRLAAFLFGAALLALLLGRDGDSAAGNFRPPDTRTVMSDIVLPDLSGQMWRLSDYRGSVVLVNFWASWCPPCREETPGLVRIATEYRARGLRVVGISLDDSAAPVRNFIARFGVPYPVILAGADSVLASAIESLPTSFLIDREGRVARVYVGAVREPELRRDIDRLLAEK